ncbi:MAG: hypothetical protein ABSE06_12285 [Anaerolineaceae bacterium]|jgi:hypothetical protein
MPRTTELNQLAIITPSQNAQLSTGLLGIENYLRSAAEANVQAAGDDFTDAEKHAMVVVEELKLVNGMDLAAILLRGKLLQEIEAGSLWTFHPGGYTTLQELARQQGISIAELSQVRSLCNIIFPYIENTLHMSVPALWEEIGRSNFCDMIGIFRGIITGEPTGSASVTAAINRALDDTAATARAAGQTFTEDELHATTISNLLTAGGQMTNAELRNHVRPTRTPAIEPTIIQVDGHQILIAEVSPDQRTMLNRKLSGYMEEPLFFQLPDDPRARQREAARIAQLRNIMRWVEGN